MEDTRPKDGRPVHKRRKASTGRTGGVKSSVLSETEQLIAILKGNKVEHYKSESVEIKFSMLAFLPDAPQTPKSGLLTEDTDELLFYSAPERG